MFSPVEVIGSVILAWDKIAPLNGSLQYEREIKNFSEFLIHPFLQLFEYSSLEELSQDYTADLPQAVAAMKTLNQMSMQFIGFIDLVRKHDRLSTYIAPIYGQHYEPKKFDIEDPMAQFFVLTYFFPIVTKTARRLIGEAYLKKHFFQLLRSTLLEEDRLTIAPERLEALISVFGFNSVFNEHGLCSTVSSDIDFKVIIASQDVINKYVSVIPGALFAKDFQQTLEYACERTIDRMSLQFKEEFSGIEMEGYVFSVEKMDKMSGYEVKQWFLPQHMRVVDGSPLDLMGKPIRRYREDPAEAELFHHCQHHAASTIPGNMDYVLGSKDIFEKMKARLDVAGGSRLELALGQLLERCASKSDTVGAAGLATGSDSDGARSSPLPSPSLSPLSPSLFGSAIVRRRSAELLSPVAAGELEKRALSHGKVVMPAAARLSFMFVGIVNFSPDIRWKFNIKSMIRINDAIKCVIALKGLEMHNFKQQACFYTIFGIALRNLKELLLLRTAGGAGLNLKEMNFITVDDLKAIYDDATMLPMLINILMAMMKQALISSNDCERIQDLLQKVSDFDQLNGAVFDFFNTFYHQLDQLRVSLEQVTSCRLDDVPAFVGDGHAPELEIYQLSHP